MSPHVILTRILFARFYCYSNFIDRPLRFREFKKFAQNHSPRVWQNCGSRLGRVGLDSVLTTNCIVLSQVHHGIQLSWCPLQNLLFHIFNEVVQWHFLMCQRSYLYQRLSWPMLALDPKLWSIGCCLEIACQLGVAHLLSSPSFPIAGSGAYSSALFMRSQSQGKRDHDYTTWMPVSSPGKGWLDSGNHIYVSDV